MGMSVYEFGFRTGAEIDRAIEGIYASRNPQKHGLLASLVFEAGNGDHLEVGTLYGASAILAALTKKEFGLSGEVFCVDPFVNENIDPSIKELTDFKVGRERVIRNAEKMGTSLNVDATPFSEYNVNRRFVSAYIDGDHTYEGVKYDFEKASQYVDKLIFFDDYNDSRFPGVRRFIDEFNDPEWNLEIIGQYAIMRKK